MLRKMMLAIVAVAGLCTASAQNEIEGTVGMDVVSRYIWRGQALGDAAVQPTATLSYKGLSLTAWSSFGSGNKSDRSNPDLSNSYGRSRHLKVKQQLQLNRILRLRHRHRLKQ